MTPSILSLQEILKALSDAPREQAGILRSLADSWRRGGGQSDYLPGSLVWLVTTPTQARLMREVHDPNADVEATILSLQEARDLLTIVGDAVPATVYEAAAWLLASPPEELQNHGEGS